MLIKKTIFQAILLFGSIVTAQNKLPYTDPENRGNWRFMSNLSDEFNGTGGIDETKWQIQATPGEGLQNGFAGRVAQFVREAVTQKDGKAIITTKWQPGFSFKPGFGKIVPLTTGALITRGLIKYGYLEARCKAADGPISSSFWGIKDNGQGEIDVFEHFGINPDNIDSERRYHTSFHDWRAGSTKVSQRIWTNEHILPTRVADDFHIYSCEWNEDYFKVWFDGILVRCVTREELGDGAGNNSAKNKWVAFDDVKIWFDSELFEWEINEDGLSTLKASDYNGSRGIDFEIDYVRVWKRGTPANINEECGPQNNFLSNSGFENGSNGWTLTGSASVVDSGRVSNGEVAFRVGGDGENAAMQQEITGLTPNTEYTVVASAKNGDSGATVFGAINYGGPEVFTPVNSREYQRYEFSFTTGATNTSALIFYFTNSEDFSSIDNLSIFSGGRRLNNIIKDANFEQEDRNAWNQSYGTFGYILKDDSVENNFISIASGTRGEVSRVVNVEPNTHYVLTAHSRSLKSFFGGNVTDPTFNDGFLGVRDYSGMELSSIFFDHEWKQRGVQFKTGPSDRTATIYFTNNNGRTGNTDLVFVDNIQLIKGVDESIIGNTLSINDFGKKNNLAFSIFPNPVKSNESLTIQSGKPVKYTIYTIDGKLLYSKDDVEKTTTTKVDVSSLNKGIYLIKIMDADDNFSTEKIVIN